MTAPDQAAGSPDAATATAQGSALAAAAGRRATGAKEQLALAHEHARNGRHEEAAASFRRGAELDRNSFRAWRGLADQLTILGDSAGADAAYAESIRASVTNPELTAAASALCDGKLAVAERALRGYLYAAPTDVAAIRMLAEVGARLGRYEDSEKLLRRALDLSPSFSPARHNYALVLHRQGKGAEALAQLDQLLAAEPDNASYRFLRAAALARVGDYDAAIGVYRELVSEHPENARAWLSLGHVSRTAGNFTESVAAYARSIACAANFGEAYWSLANLKTHRFTDSDRLAMLDQLRRADLTPEDRFHFHYALGKLYEDRGEFAQSFEHYSSGARLRREGVVYDAGDTTALTDELIAQFSPAFMAERAGLGAPAPDPIFVVGLPRAGSTLLEQILASHSAIEGTMELPDIIALAKEIGGGKVRGGAYPEALADMGGDELRRLGELYLSRTRAQRKTAKPHFIDKMPNNFQHVGLIRLILPNAKIIDARRQPMACCFSAFKQHFAHGQRFSYDLRDLGRYYADYVRLMARFDEAAPGAAHRVHYEDMVSDPEGETRRLLAFLDLPFEAACLEFHTNDRAVRTASSEQVRRPLYDSALEHWRNYETWLGPLREALGPALDNYRPRLP